MHGRKALQALWVSTLALGVIALMAVAPALRSEDAPEPLTERQVLADCPNRIERFSQNAIWYDGENRILIEAERACGAFHSALYDLSKVTLTIQKGKRVYAVLHSDTGVLADDQGTILIGPTDPKRDHGCLRGVDSLTVDLKHGIIRTPGRALNLASADGLDGGC